MTTATDGLGLLDAIKAAPGDDAPRLIYADWLEENGQEARAEFIRVQVALAKLETDSRQHECTTPGPQCHDPACPMKLWMADEGCLRRRERGLLDAHFHEWTPPLDDEGSGYLLPDRAAVRVRFNEAYADDLEMTFRRGFVGEARCTLDAWREHGPEIVAAHPVTRVELTDRGPADFSDTGDREPWSWWSDAGPDFNPAENLKAAGLPRAILGRLTGFGEAGLHFKPYLSRDAALDALSDALIAWANLSDDEREGPPPERCVMCGVNDATPGDDVCRPCREESDAAEKGES